jgi:AbrB family looped-hinge helix DNA binding protein
MTIVDTARMTTKGQITIPNRIRKLLHLKEGASVAFGLSKDGVILMPCEVTATSPYTPKEWQKIEKLASQKGDLLSDAGSARKHLASL